MSERQRVNSQDLMPTSSYRCSLAEQAPGGSSNEQTSTSHLGSPASMHRATRPEVAA